MGTGNKMNAKFATNFVKNVMDQKEMIAQNARMVKI